MATTFTKAPEVAVGDVIASWQWSKLADACNDRLKSGIGDGPWRIHFWWLNLMRQVRNSDTGGGLPAASAYPPQGEFFDIYQFVDPHTHIWPTAGPGDPEGANVANPMMAFVFGSEGAGISDEETRFLALEWPGGEPSPIYAWLYAKQQRGAVDPITGGLSCPAFDVAQSHFAFRQNDRSPYGKSYGGYLPLPDTVSCEDPDPGDDIPANPGYKYRFTQIVDLPHGGVEDGSTYYVLSGTVTYDGTDYSAGETFTGTGSADDWTGDGVIRSMKEYDGSCAPAVMDSYPTHVAYIAYWPWAYYVYTNDGTLDVLLTNVWVEGPYQGRAELRKADGGHMQRILWNFVREFRGSSAQIARQDQHLKHAFDFHRFFTSQYLLAPNRGSETGGVVQEEYPLFDLRVGTFAGAPLTDAQRTGYRRIYEDGFVFAGAFVYGTKIQGSFTVEVTNGDEVVGEFLCAAGEDGIVERLYFPDEAFYPDRGLGFRLKTPLSYKPGETGTFAIEANEILEYKPQIQDVAMVVRAMACIPNEPDGVGTIETASEQFSDDYFEFGCLFNRAGLVGPPTRSPDVNPNAVFDAARRFSKVARAPRRQDLLGYAVENGKSVLWFRRHAYGLSGDVNADAWEGIAPPRDYVLSGDILEGEQYEVRSGQVEYDDKSFTEGQRFVGVKGVTEFGGNGKVYVADGIHATAIPQGVTNEWLLGVGFAHYNLSESSIWKPGAYTDWINHLTNRCLYYAPDVATNPRTLWHMAFGQRVALQGNVYAEAPPGYNYAETEFSYVAGANLNMDTLLDPADRENFYRSCRIYEPDIEVESCESVVEGGEERVKVTLKSRLHHCEGVAPSSIDRDVSTWNTTDLRAEPYRTAENGIREYLVWDSEGTNCQHEQAGNSAINSEIYAQPDAPWGACFPKIRLTKLVPKPYEDGNDTQQTHDTKLMHDTFAMLELYLRCMCEGFVDGVTSADVACRALTGYVYDFSFQSLLLQANANRWIPAFSVEDRPDNPEGFGPMPNTVARAEVFNALSRAFNLLHTARVMLPATIECHQEYADKFSYVAGLTGDGSGTSCAPAAAAAVYAELTPSAPVPSLASPSWAGCSGLDVATTGSFTGDCDGGGGFEHRSRRDAGVFRYVLVDPDAVYALPGDLSSMLTSNSAALAEVHATTKHLRRRNVVDPGDAEECNPGGGPDFLTGAGTYLDFEEITDLDETTCGMVESPVYGPPAPRSAHYFVRFTGGGGGECFGGPEARVNVTILNTTTPMVRVLLVD